jgi:dipeptidyl aminopeptidase/acylaminoacyl peptidase
MSVGTSTTGKANMPGHRHAVALLLLLAATPLAAQQRPLEPSDIYRFLNVRDPQLSPDGEWVAYTVTRADSARDRNVTDVWMVSWDGTQDVRLTSSPDNETSPRWSPDGRHLAFLSSRQEGDGAQVWLLDRRGGEARRVTEVKGGVRAYAWSPDSRRLALVLEQETDTARADSARGTARPIVIDRYQIKQDYVGYLGTTRTKLALFDMESRRLDSLTWTLDAGLADDDAPAWSPDGTRIAFVRTAPSGPGAPANADIWVVEARPGATPRRLTDFPGPDVGPLSWSPDGRTIAFRQGDPPQYVLYQQYRVALVPADGSAPPRIAAPSVDRPMSGADWSDDGAYITSVVADDRARNLARIRVSDGSVTWPLRGRHVVEATSRLPSPTAAARLRGRTALLFAPADRAPEVYAFDGGEPRRLTSHTDSLLALVRVVPVQDFTSRSPDGTVVNSLYLPPLPAAAGGATSSPPPLVTWIHGGPHSQDEYAFHFDRQLLAASGYAVLAVNYRGSSGRGFDFGKALFADWGNREVVDMIAAVDEAVRQQLADSARLFSGGWSYGGILTNYLIATTPRFRAAYSGAGASAFASLFGVDQYVDQYVGELGYPWENPDLWMRVSYPFYQAQRIRTPTLFMVGQLDWNVPAAGSEQMYLALRSIGVPTQLVIYPNQYHGITVPSYRVDRMRRVLDWYGRYR